MIYFICTIHLHIFHGNIWTQNWPAPNVSGFIAQLVEHRTGIARSRVQAPLKSWIFFRLLYAIVKIAIITARIILHLIIGNINYVQLPRTSRAFQFFFSRQCGTIFSIVKALKYPIHKLKEFMWTPSILTRKRFFFSIQYTSLWVHYSATTGKNNTSNQPFLGSQIFGASQNDSI